MNNNTNQNLALTVQKIINNECEKVEIDNLDINQKWEIIRTINKIGIIPNGCWTYLINSYQLSQQNEEIDQNNFVEIATSEKSNYLNNRLETFEPEKIIVYKTVVKTVTKGKTYRVFATSFSIIAMLVTVFFLLENSISQKVKDSSNQLLIYQISFGLIILNAIISILLLFIYDQKSRKVATVAGIFLSFSILLSGLLITTLSAQIIFVLNILTALMLAIAFTFKPKKENIKVNA